MTSAPAARRGGHPASGDPHRSLARSVGAAAVASSLLYLISDVLEIAQGDFSTVRLVLTHTAEAHGLLMVAGGLVFGAAVVRARVLPSRTGVCLMAGVVLVAGASALPTITRTVFEAVTVTAFVGMGSALLTRRPLMSRPSGYAPP
jgi:hypothetical protein